MFIMKKIISKFSALVLSFTIISSSIVGVYADEKQDLDSLNSKYIVLMDYNSGEILYEKNSKKKIYPASTTKIWTAFCILEKADDLNEIIEVKDMPQIEGTSMYLENGEKFTVYELLESLLIHSSNDVAFLLAKHFGDGNEKKFIDFMNEEAAKYGANNTHFNNPHGLPDENHYTTAIDMTTLSRVAYSNDIIKKIVAMKSVNFKANDVYKFERTLINSNKFLNSNNTIDYKGKSIPIKYDIVDGIKTGFTDDAGNCLVSTGQKNGVRLISGVFFAPAGSLYHDSRTILDYGFDNFKTITVFKKDDLHGEKSIKFSKPGKIKYKMSSDFSVTVFNNEKFNKKDYSKKYNFDRLSLPIKKGDVIGTVNIYKKNNMVSSIALVSENDAQSYFDYVLSFTPFAKNKPKKNEKKKSGKKSDKNNKKQKDSNSSKGIANKISSGGENIKSEANKSAQGLLGILHEIKTIFSGLFTKNGLKNIENTNLYKFLDKKISNSIGFIPSKLIIIGVPVIILILILLLIIGIIKDSIKKKSLSKTKDKNNNL